MIVATLRMTPELFKIARGVPGFFRKPTDSDSIGALFQRMASDNPDRPFILFEGASYTYREANEQVNRYASVLTGRGIRRGDVVGVLSPNTARTLLMMLAIVKLGATAGMLNFNQRGAVLGHSLGVLGARLLIVDKECGDVLSSIDGPVSEGVVIDADYLDELARSAVCENPTVTVQIRADELAFHIFTSGTTGMPKASLMTHYRWLTSMSGLGVMGVRLRRDDVLYCCLPLYHNAALTVSLSSVLASGAAIAIGRHFSVSNFWTEVRANQATAFSYIGELCRYLLTREESATDRDNSIRLMVGNGLRPEIWDEFTKRFGIERVAEFYAASECNIAFVNAFDIDRTAGFCPLPYAVVRYDDETGTVKRGRDGRVTKVSKGEAGLLLAKVTQRSPFDGYSDPAATDAKLIDNAFTDGDRWFDTGDLVRQQGFRHVAFVDRLGDTFRWKGENVATTEVEGVIGRHPDIAQVAVFGVAVPGADGKTGMAAATMRTGREFDGISLAHHVIDTLPTYAIPPFIRVVDSLDTTATFKSKKAELKSTGYGQSLGRVYVLKNRDDGYVDFYTEYPAELSAGAVPAVSKSHRR